MAKRRKTKRKVKNSIFGFASKKKRRTINWQFVSLGSVLKILAVVCVLAGVAVGFLFLGKYVNTAPNVSEKKGYLELVDAPEWVNEALKEKICAAAQADGEDLTIDEDAALSIQQNIQRLVAWLDEVKIQTTNDRFLVRGRWRKPLALIKFRADKYYVDDELVLLDYLPMPHLPTVEVTGVNFSGNRPSPGYTCGLDDLAAAVSLLSKLEQMDKSITPDKPLLYEIDRIDVSNFGGRKNDRFAHIILYATDNTEIIWGAEFGAWQRYMESPDKEKLARLYAHYKEYGSLLNSVKYINLRDPQDQLFQPVDKY